MTRTMTQASLMTFCLIALAFGLISGGCGDTPKPNAAVTASPTPDPCATTNDKMIEGSIYDGIRNDPTLAPQMMHIDVLSNQRKVSFLGWADDQSSHDKVVSIAQKAACVLGVDGATLATKKPNVGDPTLPVGGHCQNGYQECGEFCIRNDQRCSIPPGPPPVGNTNSNMNPKANTNTNRKP